MQTILTPNTRSQVELQPQGAWAPCLETAAREVFQGIVRTPWRPIADPKAPLEADLSILTGLSGSLRGILGLHCSVSFAFQITSKMLGEVETLEFDNVRDAICEVGNMVTGKFKTALGTGLGEGCVVSSPSVIRGSDYQRHAQASAQHVEVGFDLAGAPLWVTLDLR